MYFFGTVIPGVLGMLQRAPLAFTLFMIPCLKVCFHGLSWCFYRLEGLCWRLAVHIIEHHEGSNPNLQGLKWFESVQHQCPKQTFIWRHMNFEPALYLTKATNRIFYQISKCMGLLQFHRPVSYWERPPQSSPARCSLGQLARRSVVFPSMLR